MQIFFSGLEKKIPGDQKVLGYCVAAIFIRNTIEKQKEYTRYLNYFFFTTSLLNSRAFFTQKSRSASLSNPTG